MKHIPLPYFEDRKSTIDMLVYHTTCFDTNKAIEVYNEYKVSPHYIIDFNGEVIKCVDEDKRAFHAGIGSWGQIKEDINSHSIGIEVLHKTLGQTPFAPAQVDSLIKLSQDILKRHEIPHKNIVGHSDIAPSRKADPGKDFPWQELAKNGIGLWYDINDSEKVNLFIPTMLAEIGYDISDIPAASYAFCRRFAPFAVNNTDIDNLLDNPYPKDFNISENIEVLKILKAVYYAYK